MEKKKKRGKKIVCVWLVSDPALRRRVRPTAPSSCPSPSSSCSLPSPLQWPHLRLYAFSGPEHLARQVKRPGLVIRSKEVGRPAQEFLAGRPWGRAQNFVGFVQGHASLGGGGGGDVRGGAGLVGVCKGERGKNRSATG